MMKGSRIGVAVALAVGGFAVAVAQAGDGDAIAIVNGRPISERKFVEVLKDAHGLEIMQQLIVLELAKAESKRLDLRVTAGDVDAEFEAALDRIAPEVNARGAALSDEERRQSLEMLLQQKGITLAEFMIGMERNAHLRKVVERELEVDEGTLREEFARVYGEKVLVRHIQVEAGNIDQLHEALNLLDKGVPFEEVAARVSVNTETAARGGQMEPFSFSDEQIPAVLREAAFALDPGQRTQAPIKAGRYWHLLKLERRIRPTDVRFEDVREEVARSLRERVVPERMNNLITRLFAEARIQVLDRELRKRFERLLKENEAPTGLGTP
jgi:foldase protein PrsA